MEHNTGYLPFPPTLGDSLPGADSVETFNFDNLSDDSSQPSTSMPILHPSAPTPKSNQHQRWRAKQPATEMPNIPDLQPFYQHLSLWVATCDKLKIKITLEKAEAVVAAYRDPQGQSSNTRRVAGDLGDIPRFSLEAFVDALIAFIVGTDQSFNIVESPELHRIFLMLREELTNADIPHQT
ncbi:hypothetical protein ARMGADRAFT_1084967 [Armillaria gallica]|uniref:Uncharacterized protein n=1 Tax=Armillaria gallica TaxID=47427 RepID=A0A2H3CY65_ARMGA|nr:hypothetical protein ARMGADRAFT_1084967 [Armillaria gallica]